MAEKSEAYTVMIGMPAPLEDNGEWPLDHDGRPVVQNWIPIAEAKSWGIARYLAYSIAQRGIPTAWPKQDNSRDEPILDNWYTCSVERAYEAKEPHLQAVFREAVADRAMLAAHEARSRGRIGNIIGELRALADASENPDFRELVNRGVVYIGQAMSTNIMPENSSAYGYDWVRSHVDLMRAALQAWNPGMNDDEACPHCGEVHEHVEANAHDIARAISQHFGIDVEPVDPIGDMLEAHDPETPQA